ncbi:unnamed protein product [Sphagnum tenellum]
MRYYEIINEGVVLNGAKQIAAYAITVAEAFDRAPKHDPAAEKIWQALANHNRNVMFKKIASDGIKIIWEPGDAYGAETDDPMMMCRYMLWDMCVNHRLRVFSGNSDTHTVFSPEDNVIFRTVHDYFAHGKLRAAFKKQSDKIQNRKPTPEELKAILPTISLSHAGNIGHGFNLRGEMNAYVTHTKLVPPSVAPALFTEVVGQACYQTIVQEFPGDKVALLSDFDFKNVGKMRPGSISAKRFAEILANWDTSPVIQTSIRAKPEVVLADVLRTVSSR